MKSFMKLGLIVASVSFCSMAQATSAENCPDLRGQYNCPDTEFQSAVTITVEQMMSKDKTRYTYRYSDEPLKSYQFYVNPRAIKGPACSNGKFYYDQSINEPHYVNAQGNYSVDFQNGYRLICTRVSSSN